MKKIDLKTGMRVRLRNGDIFLVLKDVGALNCGKQDVMFVNLNAFSNGTSYNEDLTNKNYENLDIVKIYNPSGDGCFLNVNFLNLDVKYKIWEREEELEPERYYYLKHKYLGGVKECYLNESRCVEPNFLELASKVEVKEFFRTKFTDDDIERMQDKYGLRIVDFELEEVEDE